MFQGIASYISGMVEVDADTSFWNAVDEKFEEQGRILSPEFTLNFRVLLLCKIAFIQYLSVDLFRVARHQISILGGVFETAWIPVGIFRGRSMQRCLLPSHLPRRFSLL